MMELGNLAMLYRQQLSGKELLALTVTWADICNELTDDDFSAACKAHMVRAKFFPCPADILELHEARKTRVTLQNAEEDLALTPEQEIQREINAKMLLKSLRNPACKQFFELKSWGDKYQFAKNILGDKCPTAAIQ